MSEIDHTALRMKTAADNVDGPRESEKKLGPWNPGLESQIPDEVTPYMTIVRAENVFQSISELMEISDFTGLRWEDIATFRPQRLAVHELLIRISANLSVSDGNRYEDLGVNFRSMAQVLFDRCINPNMQQIVNLYEELKKDVSEQVEQILECSLYASHHENDEPKEWFNRLFKRRKKKHLTIPMEVRDQQLVNNWMEDSQRGNISDLQRSILRSLNRLANALMVRHGRICGEKDLLIKLVVGQVCNSYGSRLIGNMIEPMIDAGASAEGYSTLPIREHPVIMNVKGASASGKSTLRPLQHQLANRLGLCWESFALISPDIWRKYLLDYKVLGEHAKYAAVCSGHELKIVDRKLDLYMADKANRIGVSHLLIDRFRFDSFAEKSTKEGSNLLTRFGSKVFMFFMITPPHDTVVRAWERGERVGRYKAVDDLLAHNVEAFTGISQLFFTWALDQEKEIHYEFLDNSVDLGEDPKTVAFGENGILRVLDVICMIDIDRYQKINVNALSEDDVYPPAKEMSPQMNMNFVKSCIERLQCVEFVNPMSRKVMASTNHGELVELNVEELKEAISDGDVFDALLDLLSSLRRKNELDEIAVAKTINIARSDTLGDW
jgi:DNA-binding transcriptional regulator GbsR (MarR family)